MTRIFKLVITLALALCSTTFFAQIEIDDCVGGFYFDNETPPFEFLYIDSINNPQNSWQIGIPEKDNISLPYTPYISIVTDTMLPYPTNDTSTFIVSTCHFYSGGFLPYVTVSDWKLYYYMDTDSLNDFGLIEVSIDEGNTWWDLYSAGFHQGDTILTGNTGGLAVLWFDPTFYPSQDFYNHMMDLSDAWTIPIETMWIKFTFISDDNAEEKMGWVIEKLDGGQGIFSSVDNIKTIFFTVKTFPNPANNIINLQIENENLADYDIQFFTNTGQVVFQTSIQYNNQREIDVSHFSKGIYHYVVTKLDDQKKGFGKLIIQ